MTASGAELFAAGRLQEAECLMRRGVSAPLSLGQVAERLGTRLAHGPFFVSPGYSPPYPAGLRLKPSVVMPINPLP